MKTNFFFKFAALTAITLMSTSCLYLNADGIVGVGNIASETIELPTFNSIHVSGSADVFVSKGDTLSVTLSDYENLLAYWDLEVVDNSLHVKTKPFSSLVNTRAKVTITLPSELYLVRISGSGDINLNSDFPTLNKVKIEGSGTVYSSQSAGYENLEIYIGGSGDVHLTGNAQQLIAKINGSGAVKLGQLSTVSADCTISGSGNIYIDAQETLKASIFGSGNIIYTGRPVIDMVGSGSGKLIHN